MITFNASTGWNPRYLAYCVAHGEPDPDKMLTKDSARWTGCMTGYILWIQARWSEWRRLMGYKGSDPLWPIDHAMFDMWLFTGVIQGEFPREGHA